MYTFLILVINVFLQNHVPIHKPTNQIDNKMIKTLMEL